MSNQKQKLYKYRGSHNTNMLPSDPSGLLDESFPKETLVFIDANFLSKLSNHFGKKKYLIYDLFKFSYNLAKKQKLNCRQIFYYTAPPFQSEKPTKEEEIRKDGYDRLKKKEIIVQEGRCQRLKIDGNLVYKQKAVDILMAMDLMRVPLKFPKIKKIILIASDSDFVPVVKSLEEEGIKAILYTYYEKKRDTNFSRSNHLIKSVHKYVLLKKEDFDDAPLNKIIEGELNEK
ncbi:MAG: NYN domain-containing protein [Nanoarchaeota archaeon]